MRGSAQLMSQRFCSVLEGLILHNASHLTLNTMEQSRLWSGLIYQQVIVQMWPWYAVWRYPRMTDETWVSCGYYKTHCHTRRLKHAIILSIRLFILSFIHLFINLLIFKKINIVFTYLFNYLFIFIVLLLVLLFTYTINIKNR